MVCHRHPFRPVHHGGQVVTARKTGTESWDDFWRDVSGARTEVIRGVEVPVPTDYPLGFQERLTGLNEESAAGEFAAMVDVLYGDGIYARWMDAGMGAIELITAVTWGMLQANGHDVTFRQAHEAATSGDPGKALGQNRQARRTASKPRSASTGGRSGRTSAASTASARKSSRA